SGPRPATPPRSPYTALFRSHHHHRLVDSDRNLLDQLRPDVVPLLLVLELRLGRVPDKDVLAVDVGQQLNLDLLVFGLLLLLTDRSEEHTSELQSRENLVCRL